MGGIGFNIVVKPLLYALSRLPFPILYLKSDVFFLIVYYVIGYRKKVVLTNLRNAFPEKTEAERLRIARDFYRHFCDVMMETVKLLTISKKEFMRRCAMDAEARDWFGRHFRENRSIVGVMGHCGNWEWGAIAHQVYFNSRITGVYHPLSNPHFDKLMLGLRSRFGGEIVPMTQVYKKLLQLRSRDIRTTVGLIADQTPPAESAYWTTFLNQDTPIFNGPEKLAKKFNWPVMYMKIIKERRGYYRLSIIPIAENPSDFPNGAISELHAKALEDNIREQPHAWLWSHRRWKHKRIR